MARIPDMNLDPAATPWGRWMQDKIAELDRSAERRASAEVNANKGLNATLAALSGQIATIAAQQTVLDQTVASLANAQTTLAGQQTTLNQTVTGLAGAQTTLTGQQTFLAGLKTTVDAKTTTRVDGAPPFPQYTLLAFRAGIDPTLTVAIPTGHALITVSVFADLASPAPGGLVQATFTPEMVGVDPTANENTPGVMVGADSFNTSAYVSTGTSFQKVYTVAPGTYTVRMRTSLETGGSSTVMTLTSYYRALSVQVIP